MEIPQSYNGKPLKASWKYCARDGAPIGVVGRYQNRTEKKDIVPYFRRNGSGWKAGIDQNPRPLFGLEKLATHPKEKAVFVVEGEKSAAAFHSLGIVALTSLGGSKAANQSDWTPLNGYKLVYLMPDNDEPGELYARDVYQVLSQLQEPPIIKVLRLSGLQEAGDVVDWVQSRDSDWDGYSPIPENLHQELKDELREELKKAEPIPAKWSLAGLAGAELAGFEWGKPNEIKSRLPDVQAMPNDMIPLPLRVYLSDVSHRMQTPPDFAAVTSVVIAGSIIGAGCGIRPKRKDDWEVIPNVWGACIGRPSVVLKSPSMKEPMQLLERLQYEYGKCHEEQIKDFEFNKKLKDAALKDVESKIAKVAKGTGKDGVIDNQEVEKLRIDYKLLTDDMEEPARRLFKTNETSIQSMTVIQDSTNRGILAFRDELTGMLVKWDTKDEDERAYFLEGWNGDGSYTDVKIGRGIIDAKNICISLFGGIQPDKLAKYLYQAQKGNNDGLMQRLQLAVWPDEPKHWELIDIYPDKEAKQRAYDIFEKLADMDFTEYGAVQSEYDNRPHFRFNEAGQHVFNSWLTELQTVKLKDEDIPLMVEHLGKFRSLMPGLALIFHLMDIADGKQSGPISEQAALLAVQWCEYLETHARRIYAISENPEHAAAVRLSEKIKCGKLANPFTAKQVYDKCWYGLKDRLEVEAACNILIDENWLKMNRKPNPATGRPPLPVYRINPDFL